MNNVEEFLVVQNQNTFQLQVRFVSGAERVLYTGNKRILLSTTWTDNGKPCNQIKDVVGVLSNQTA